MVASRKIVEQAVAEGRVVYGVSTGFGKLSDRVIPEKDLARLQINLLRSHAVGLGEPFDEPSARAIMLLRANTLAGGLCGVRPVVCERLLDLLNADVTPWIPTRGSVGASGDLAPLAHLGLALIGEGEVYRDGRPVAAADVAAVSGVEPLTLEAKEGLSLINGTQVMTGVGVLTLLAAERVVAAAEVAGAMSLDATCGTRSAFGEAIHTARRCMPQVHGAVRDALRYVRSVLEIEINAATDNPLVFVDGDDPHGGAVVSGGNFHGAPVAAALDFLATAVTDLASISERRIEALIDTRESGLPAFLANKPGLESGFMAQQIVAAALVSECKGLAHPASVDSIPTGADREDHVSMGAWAAQKARMVVDNAERVIAIELLAAAQGIDFRRPLKTSPSLEEAHRHIRAEVPRIDTDRSGSADTEALVGMIRSGTLLRLGAGGSL
jgi:histidine ammonia-lyase